LIEFAAVGAARRLADQQLVVRCELPPLGLSKRGPDVADLFLPGLVLGSHQIERPRIATAAEIGGAKPGDDISAGHDNVPRRVANGGEAGAVVLVGHAIAALIAEEIAILRVD